MIWQPDPRTLADGHHGCRLLVCVATEETLYVLAEAPGRADDGGDPQQAGNWFIRVRAADVDLDFRRGAHSEADRRRTFLTAVYEVGSVSLPDTLDVVLELDHEPVYQVSASVPTSS